MVFILGPTVENIKDNGKIIECTGKEDTFGQMEDNMKVII